MAYIACQTGMHFTGKKHSNYVGGVYWHNYTSMTKLSSVNRS